MLAVLINGNQLTILIWRILERGHVGMGMSAKHEVATFGEFQELLIRIL